MHSAPSQRTGAALVCVSCGTEFGAAALACPACDTLVHARELKTLAANADAAELSRKFEEARERWRAALLMLPANSRQYATISQRVAALTTRIDAAGGRKPARSSWSARAYWRVRMGGAAFGGLFILAESRFPALGTDDSRALLWAGAIAGSYWRIYGWPLALAAMVSMYIHQLGHAVQSRRLGIATTARAFVPGFGALDTLRTRVAHSRADARLGLAGPVFGMCAGLAALAMYMATGNTVWRALAQITGFANLFALIPVWRFDGARAFRALSRWERWIVVAVSALALYLTSEPLLFVLCALSIWHASEEDARQGAGDSIALGALVLLIGAFAWLSQGFG